ncbi:TPA: sodium:solute symporter, partial [Candidatus Latescibacteria bacterium]|nr:sodium:solute symporter [Candidatus Latescibacterota bacterium]
FLVAGRRLGLVLSTGTLAATWFGGGIVVGASSEAYKNGFLGVIADPFGAALCLIIAGLFYVRTMRRMGLTTIASFFEVRFGPNARVIAALCTIPTYIGWVASLMVAFGRVVQVVAGVDPDVGIWIGAAIVLFYTTAGGMWAVTLTDFIQVSVLVVGLVFLAPMILADAGGWNAIRSQVPDSTFHLYPHGGDGAAWFSYFRDWLVIGLGNLAGQDLIQRSLSSRNEQIAQNSAYLSALLYLTVGFIPVFLGIAGRVVLPDLENPDLVMMTLGTTYLPPVALSIFLGALISALLSSADSALLAPASVISWDLLKRFKPDVDERTILCVSRITVPLLGLFSLYLAFSANTIYSLMVDSWSILLATLFVPLTAGIWWQRANATGCLASMMAGFVSWILFLEVYPNLPADLMAVPVAAIALVIGSLVGADTPRPLADESGEQISLAGRIGLKLH